jgi:isopenicillin-N epimerase
MRGVYRGSWRAWGRGSSVVSMPRVLRPHFLPDPRVVFLNHGSFGSCPRAVLDVAESFRVRFERDPIAFVVNELEPGLDAARRAAGEFVGADPEDLVFVKNATAGVNTVLASFGLAPGDEVLITDHGYGACNNAAHEWAARAGARAVTAAVPFPVTGPDAVIGSVLAAVTPKTRLAVLDHATSPTGIVFPIAELVKELRARGVATLIDGAHGPGMVPLDLRALGADYYVGNFHKWCCAPKAVAFLHTVKERQAATRPLVVSHGARNPRKDRSRYLLEFDWVGTDDASPALALPFTLAFVGDLMPGGWDAVRAHNRELALTARRVLLEAVGGAPACPESMVGGLAAVTLPDAKAPTKKLGWPFAEPLYSTLRERYGIEAMVIHFPAPPKQLVRVSAHVYNDVSDYQALAEALQAELR